MPHKTISEKQLAANRANAARSTGKATATLTLTLLVKSFVNGDGDQWEKKTLARMESAGQPQSPGSKR